MYKIQALDTPITLDGGLSFPAEWVLIDARSSRTLAAARLLEICLKDAHGTYRVVSPQGVVTLTSDSCRETIAARREWQESR